MSEINQGLKENSFYDLMKEYIAKKGAVRLKVEDPNNPNIMYNRHKGVKSHE